MKAFPDKSRNNPKGTTMFTTSFTAIRKIILPAFAAIAFASALPLAAPLSSAAFANGYHASHSRDHDSGKDHAGKKDRSDKNDNSGKDNSGKDLNSGKDSSGRDSSVNSGWDVSFDG